jgi:DNA-3-methyladenine glycosylase II
VVPEHGDIEHLDDREIITRLNIGRGVGNATVEIYLMFTLGRPNDWSVDAPGVRKGWAVALSQPCGVVSLSRDRQPCAGGMRQ